MYFDGTPKQTTLRIVPHWWQQYIFLVCYLNLPKRRYSQNPKKSIMECTVTLPLDKHKHVRKWPQIDIFLINEQAILRLKVRSKRIQIFEWQGQREMFFLFYFQHGSPHTPWSKVESLSSNYLLYTIQTVLTIIFTFSCKFIHILQDTTIIMMSLTSHCL